MATVLWATMVLHDAADGVAPTHGLTLTTKAAQTPPERLRRDVELVRRALRREVGGFEECGHIEFTTGAGKRSGGHRRIHQHGLCKLAAPLTESDRLALEEVARRVWERQTGAHRVELAELRTPAGAAHYLTHHHGKRAQLPPLGWTGRRFRATRGYFALPRDERVAQARAQLRSEGLLRRVRQTLRADVQLADVDDDVWNAILTAELARARDEAAQGVELVRVQRVPTEFGTDGLPSHWATEVLGPAQ